MQGRHNHEWYKYEPRLSFCFEYSEIKVVNDLRVGKIDTLIAYVLDTKKSKAFLLTKRSFFQSVTSSKAFLLPKRSSPELPVHTPQAHF